MKKVNQLEQIKSHLFTYGSITSLEAFQKYFCTRLAARILELRNKGYNIESQWQTKPDKRWVSYVLHTGSQQKNVLMIHFLWFLVIVLAIVSQNYIIEKLKRYPNKLLWFLLRVVVAIGFLCWYMSQGYMWYWTILFMVSSFWWPFNTFLNILRKKSPDYYSAKNSLVDRLLLKIFRYEELIFFFSFILMLIGVGIMYFYGQRPFNNIP